MELRQLQTFYTDRADAELFQNGRDAGVFAVGSDGSDPPAGKRTWEKGCSTGQEKKVVLTPQGKNFWSMLTGSFMMFIRQKHP